MYETFISFIYILGRPSQVKRNGSNNVRLPIPKSMAGFTWENAKMKVMCWYHRAGVVWSQGQYYLSWPQFQNCSSAISLTWEQVIILNMAGFLTASTICWNTYQEYSTSDQFLQFFSWYAHSSQHWANSFHIRCVYVFRGMYGKS